MRGPRSLIVPTLLLWITDSLPAQDRPPSLPVNVTALVDAATIATTGRTQLSLRFVCEAPLDEPLSVRIELRENNRLVLRRDHTPPTPTRQWKPNQPVAYDLPLVFTQVPDGVEPGDLLTVFLGFRDASGNRMLPPLSPSVGRDGMAPIADFTFPGAGGSTDAAAVDATIAQALAIATKQPRAAWDQLEYTFRRLDDYPLKQKVQKALLQVGRTPAPALTFEEQGIVADRIGGERARYLRLVSGRMFDRGKLHGALLLLDEVGGSLQQDADRAVIGALDEARRATQDRDGICKRIFALSPAQEAEVEALAQKHPKGADRLRHGLQLAADKAQRGVARELIRTLEFTPELRETAAAERSKLEAAWLADVPADERAEAEAALKHPCWARTKSRVTHRFVILGPEALIESIPDDSLLRFDLAYLYVTDLFGRVPNPDGDRVTVYWKELWDFGGGVGGGKIIDIGNAKPDAKGVRADTGLLYHELTHCVDDTTPVYGGMREGLADVGAAFAQMELGQVAGGRAAIGLAQRAFLQDYLERDLEYWRIPNYGPSAGFFLHFLVTYGKSAEGYRWELYRKFFRDYRSCRVKDARTPTLARAFAYHLVQAFGDAAFADLQRFRWPLIDSDLEAVRREQDAAKARQLGPTFDELPGSPVPRDRLAKQLDSRKADADQHADELGVVRQWWVIGPFRKQGVDPDTYRFPPELEIDLQARYESINNNPIWRQPGPKPVLVERTGWVAFDFAYMDDSAEYALTHVTADTDLEAWFHLRADDDVTLFVDDELIGKHDFATGSLGPWRPGRNVHLPDAVSFRVPLRAGRHKVLVKVRNNAGEAGFSLAIAQRNGLPLPGWRADLEPPAKQLAALDAPPGEKWPSRWKARFDAPAAAKKLEPTVGQWRVRNGALEGHATGREVEWRKYTVRPGFPKDSPSNLAWLPEKATEQLEAFQLTVELPAGSPPPKLCVIVQGDGQRDALCGWTLILDPDGDRVRAYLERYDLRMHMADAVPFASDGKKPTKLVLAYFGKRLSVRLGDHVLFDQAPLLPIPGKHRIGLATWGEQLRLEAMELRGPTRTR
jgi:hypothetical protein